MLTVSAQPALAIARAIAIEPTQPLVRACYHPREVRRVEEHHRADARQDKADGGRIFTKPVDEETFEFCKHEMRNMQRGSVMSERVRRMRGALARAMGM